MSEAVGGEGAALGPQRLEAFSDGVMAVIITIMALGLRVPSSPTWAAAEHRLPELLTFALSFTFIAIYWNNHHHLLRATRVISGGVMWANMLLLFWLALIPVLTAWIARAPGQSVPAAFYGMDAAAAGTAYAILVRVIIRANSRSSEIARAIGRDFKGTASVVAYLVAIGLALLSPYLAYATYAGVAVMWMVPDRRLLRPPSAPAPGTSGGPWT
jgi:uncharacterized membrane protein